MDQHGAQQRIVVIEDEEAIADAVMQRLRGEGFDVEWAADGIVGVELCERVRPDLVVLDLMLPGLDGLEVCRRIQAERRTPVLMLTARDDESDLLVGLAVGADDYLTKPFSPRELVARVRAVLRRAEPQPAPADEAPLVVLDIEIDRADRGKPRLGGAPSPFAFNLSDADDHVAAAFGLGFEIGVDIERADRRTVEPERFARRVLSVAEQSAIEGLDDDALDRALIRMWTRKEAVLKAAGHGLRRELADVDTVADVVMLDGNPWSCWTTNWRDLVVSVAWGQSPTR